MFAADDDHRITLVEGDGDVLAQLELGFHEMGSGVGVRYPLALAVLPRVLTRNVVMMMLPASTTSGSAARFPVMMRVDVDFPSSGWLLLCRGACRLLTAVAFEVVHGVDGHFVSIHLLEISCGITHRDHFLSTNYFFCLLARGIDSDWEWRSEPIVGRNKGACDRVRESGHAGMEGTTMTGQNGQNMTGSTVPRSGSISGRPPCRPLRRSSAA